MSPVPGRSTLITSAPNHARSCVQVGPDCTCVKSRMRTPSNALPIARPLLFLCRWIEARDAAALGAAAFVDHCVDERRPLAADGLFHRVAQFVGRGDVGA